MIQPIRRRATQSLIAAAVALCLPLAALCLPKAADGATINIILSDMDVTYLGSMAGGAIFDAMGGFSGGALDEAAGTADDISTAVFELDDTVQGVLVNGGGNGDDIHTDLRIVDVGATITKNVLHPSLGNSNNAFGIDLFTDTGVQLRLAVDDVQLLLSNGVFFFTGEANVYGNQVLPFGLPNFSTATPVQFSFTATMPAVNGALTSVGQAGGSGALTITGLAIPEPATVLLAVLGGVASIALLRRRKTRH